MQPGRMNKNKRNSSRCHYMAVIINMFDIFLPHRQVGPFFEQCLEKRLFYYNL